MNESHQRTIRSLEGRVTALTDDLEVTQSELHAIQAEYDGYKVSYINSSRLVRHLVTTY